MDTTYDVDATNKLLDEMGITMGADGFRVGPDGKKFTIPFEEWATVSDLVLVTELIVEQWKALGLDVTMKTIDVVRSGAPEVLLMRCKLPCGLHLLLCGYDGD